MYTHAHATIYMCDAKETVKFQLSYNYVSFPKDTCQDGFQPQRTENYTSTMVLSSRENFLSSRKSKVRFLITR